MTLKKTDTDGPDFTRVLVGTTLKHALYDFLQAHGVNLRQVYAAELGINEVVIRQRVVNESGAFVHSRNVGLVGKLFNALGQEVEEGDLFWDDDSSGPIVDGEVVPREGSGGVVETETRLPIANPTV